MLTAGSIYAIILKTLKTHLMKHFFYAATALLPLLASLDSAAQCDTTLPVITPKNLLLCPNTKDTLFTTEPFDTYQWYKNGDKIPGATLPYYIVDQYEDAASFFKVETTRKGCTAMSKRVLVDGYVFASPVVIHTGDIGIFDIRRDASIFCPGDTMTLTMGSPYTENLQWYDSYKPIPGANKQSYIVTETGSYTVCGAPKICPDFTACQNIPVNAIFENPVATITEKNDTLFASKARSYRWFLGGNPIPGAEKDYYVPTRNGKYTVAAKDRWNCVALSKPYAYRQDAKPGISNLISFAPNPVHDVMRVTVKSPDVKRIVISDMFGKPFADIKLVQPTFTIPVTHLPTGSYLLQVYNIKQQVIGSAQLFKE